MPFRLPSRLLSFPTSFSSQELLLHALISPNILADIMVGEIYIVMTEREGRDVEVIGNPKLLIAHISQQCRARDRCQRLWCNHIKRHANDSATQGLATEADNTTAAAAGIAHTSVAILISQRKVAQHVSHTRAQRLDHTSPPTHTPQAQRRPRV